MSTDVLARNLKSLWWLPMAKGVLAVVAGVVALLWPGPTLAALVVVLGAYVVVDSVLNLVNARALRGLPGGRVMIVFGIVGILVGALMLWHPGPVLHIVVTLIGAWVALVGLLLVAVSLPLMPLTRRAWLWPLLGGVVCLGLGVAGLVHPGFGAAALGWLVGIGVIAYGAAHIGLAVGLRKLTGSIARAADEQLPTVIEGQVVPDPDDRSGQDGDGQVIEGRVED